MTSDDLHKIYGLHFNDGEVVVWCDGISEVGATDSRTTCK